MNKRQSENYMRLRNNLAAVGITQQETATLLRCERTLQRWAERECGDGSNWGIERDEETGKPFNVYHGPGERMRYAIADRETGAIRRATAIAKAHGLGIYHQGDCRGCMLYIIRPGDVPEGQAVGSYYNRGIAVCID
jgi:hypothetical protein